MNKYKNFLENIQDFDTDIKLSFDTSGFVTFKAGGIADVFVVPKNIEALTKIIYLVNDYSLDYICIGGGSNLLVRDGGYKGVMISLIGLNDMCVNKNVITAQSGNRLSAVTSFALSNSLIGMEFAGGIPGTVGGAVYMNAGAYGGEIKDIIISADVIDSSGKISTLSKDELELSYRYSKLMEKKQVVVSADFLLDYGDAEKAKKYLKELNQRRRDKQPTDMPSAGSTFKRPEGYYAAALIDEAGLKGLSVGGAEVSNKHAGFIVNKGGATANDIETLINLVKNKVLDNSGVQLELEVCIIGNE